MKILYLTPNNPNILTPETGFANYLGKLGHDVSFVFTPVAKNADFRIFKGNVDIVVGAMEYSMHTALDVGKMLNVPVYNHMEWIPPWRVGAEPKEDWGFEENTRTPLLPVHFKNFKQLYQKQTNVWEAATVKSCAGHTLFPYIKPFCKNKNVDYDVHYYAANFDKLKNYVNPKIVEQNHIVTTARLVPHKRVHHIIRALGKLKSPPVLDIIGYGPEVFNIENEAKQLGVNVNFYGPGKGGVKESVMQRAMFAVQIWAGLPIAECLYYNTPSIAYEQHHMKEVLGDSTYWAKNNDVDDLAEKIQYFIDNPVYRKEFALKGKELMLNNRIGMGTPERLVNDLTKIMQKGVDKYEPPKAVV